MNTAQRQTAEGIHFTDAYQLTMAHLYYRMGLHEKLAQKVSKNPVKTPNPGHKRVWRLYDHRQKAAVDETTYLPCIVNGTPVAA